MTRANTLPLGEVATIERSSVQPADIQPGTMYVGLEDIDSGGAVLRPRAVDAGDLASSKFSFTEAHVLYGKLRPYLGKIAAPDFAGICSTDIVPVRPGPLIDRRYLLHFLRQPTMVAYAASRSVGINLPRLSPTVLETFPIPIVPLPEQRRIAEALDRVEELRAKRRAALAQLQELSQSIFLHMFGDPATNPRKLNTACLGELGKWHSGGTPPRSQASYFVGDIPWFSSGELNGVYVSESAEHISERTVAETSAKIVPKGALMLGMYDSAALKASIAGVRCSCNQAIAFASLGEAQADTVFVYYAIVIGREHFKSLQRGIRQKNLNLSMIRAISIPLPSINRQREFAYRVAAISKLVAKQRAGLTQLDALFSSVHHRAFRGEL